MGLSNFVCGEGALLSTGTPNFSAAKSVLCIDIGTGIVYQNTDGAGTWVVFSSGPAGDITSVIAGTNLTGGATSGAATLNAPTMTATVGGAVPTPPNDVAQFLRGDATWGAAGGSVSDGDKGDVTVSGSGAAWLLALNPITPGGIGSVNNYNPTDLAIATVLRVFGSPGASTRNITGVAAQADGRILIIVHSGGPGSGAVAIVNESASSTDVNRFLLPVGVASILIENEGGTATFFYDGPAQRWKQLANTSVNVKMDQIVGNYITIVENVTGKTFEVETGGPRWTAGSGSPEGAVGAPVGSIFSRTDGGASTSLYVKESGTGNTGWKALVAVV